MQDLIDALLIFKKYSNEQFPTHCEHDVLMIASVQENEMSEEDTKEIERLGFFWNDEYDSWVSYRFGSA